MRMTGPYGLAQTGPDKYKDTDKYRQVQATLAVAWEARTANLIAWRALSRDGELNMKLDEEISARLGLD